MSFIQKHTKKIIFVFFITVSAIAGLMFAINNYYYINTDDAYVNANVIQIAPRVVGKVTNVYIKNNQYVEKGQALFDLDQAPYQALIDSASAQVSMYEAQLDKSTIIAKRISTLVKRKYLSQQDNDNAVAALKTATGKLQYAKATLAQVSLNLKYTKIYAPRSGWIADLSLQAGDVVSANQAIFALISDEEFWVDANFKETQIADIKPGQTAKIITDLYPHHAFKGVVTSISNVTGTAFSLLPPQNATGNWVKITQRIPVRIHIINVSPDYPLRIGISASVSIDRQEKQRTS